MNRKTYLTHAAALSVGVFSTAGLKSRPVIIEPDSPSVIEVAGPGTVYDAKTRLFPTLEVEPNDEVTRMTPAKYEAFRAQHNANLKSREARNGNH